MMHSEFMVSSGYITHSGAFPSMIYNSPSTKLAGIRRQHESHRRIADGRVTKSTASNNNNNNGKKSSAYATVHQKTPQQTARRNERERNRVKQVNQGFATLRQYVPSDGTSGSSTSTNGGNGKAKKLSKVETLRSAARYIQYLHQMLSGEENSQCMNDLMTATGFPGFDSSSMMTDFMDEDDDDYENESERDYQFMPLIETHTSFQQSPPMPSVVENRIFPISNECQRRQEQSPLTESPPHSSPPLHTFHQQPQLMSTPVSAQNHFVTHQHQEQMASQYHGNFINFQV